MGSKITKIDGERTLASARSIFRNLLTTKHFKQIVPRTKTRSIGFTPAHMTTPHTRHQICRLSRPIVLGTIASCLSILAGIVPDLSAQQPDRILSGAARADEIGSRAERQHRRPQNKIDSNRRSTMAQSSEEFSDVELQNYAAALMQIEPLRQSTLSQTIRANGGGALPNLVCNQPSTMEGLNGEAKSLFVKYCNQSESIAASKGLSIDKFNQITQSVRSNSHLQNRVRGFMK